MTKNEFIKELAKRAHITQDTAKEVLNAAISIITEKLKAGESVLFSGFGSFYVSNRSERPGRNPRTGEKITLPAFKLPAFKVGAVLKKEVNSQEKPKKTNAKGKKK